MKEKKCFSHAGVWTMVRMNWKPVCYQWATLKKLKSCVHVFYKTGVLPTLIKLFNGLHNYLTLYFVSECVYIFISFLLIIFCLSVSITILFWMERKPTTFLYLFCILFIYRRFSCRCRKSLNYSFTLSK